MIARTEGVGLGKNEEVGGIGKSLIDWSELA